MVNSPRVKIQTNRGTLVVELYPEHAPNTVHNFLRLIRKKFYDGLTFHRVIEDFMIQGGCPKGDGTGGPGWAIKCETEGNPLIHDRGALSMAHSGKDTGGSQFFICLTRSQTAHLDGKHTVFGQVVRGMNILEGFSNGDKMLRVTEMGTNTASSGKEQKKRGINRQALQQKLREKKHK